MCWVWDWKFCGIVKYGIALSVALSKYGIDLSGPCFFSCNNTVWVINGRVLCRDPWLVLFCQSFFCLKRRIWFRCQSTVFKNNSLIILNKSGPPLMDIEPASTGFQDILTCPASSGLRLVLNIKIPIHLQVLPITMYCYLQSNCGQRSWYTFTGFVAWFCLMAMVSSQQWYTF